MSWDALPPNVRDAARAALTPDEYDCLRLYAHGLGYRRIAATLNITRDTARNRTERALTRLRTELEARGINESTLRTDPTS